MLTILPNWHPLFVHFTVALLIVATAMHVLSHFVSNSGLRNQLTIVARWNLWIGVGFTLITVALGWYAYYTVDHDTPSHLAMTIHRNWAMATLVAFLGIAAWEFNLHRHGKGKGWLFTSLLVGAASLVLVTAWHGGELVYRYGLGVMSMPKPDGAGHDHDHGGMDHGDMPMQGEKMDGHADSHDKGASSGHPHDAGAGLAQKTPAINGAGAAPKQKGHAHAPGTPPHKD